MSEEVAGTSNGVRAEDSDEMMVYKKKACKVVTFRIIFDESDESNKVTTFHPEMAHQIFGESESIFGYRDVNITINMLHNSSRCYLNLQTSGKISKRNLKPDDIMKSLDPWLPANYTQSEEEFAKWVKEEKHDVMYGTAVKSFNNKDSTYSITQSDTTSKEFQEFHARFETYIIWFIDAANYIDLEDEKWLIFYVYEEFKHPDKNILYRTPIAFCTVYKFYCYPDKVRPRISQIFVLPSHQRKGIGTSLYETVSKILRADEQVVDLAVEEPTPYFQKIRDLEDCGLLHKKLQETGQRLSTAGPKRIFQMGQQLKIGRKQIQRVYDILGLYYASQMSGMQHKRVLESIKERILNDLKREMSPGKHFRNLQGEAFNRENLVSKTELAETTFVKYYDEIKPSVEYLKANLDSWLQRNDSKA